jgi:hypothetical protein
MAHLSNDGRGALVAGPGSLSALVDAVAEHLGRGPAESLERFAKFDGVPFVQVQGPFTGEEYGLTVWGRDDADDAVQRDVLVAALKRTRPAWLLEADD